MKILKTMSLLVVSVLIWILFVIPNALIFVARFVKSILTIIERTLIYLMDEIRREVIK